MPPREMALVGATGWPIMVLWEIAALPVTLPLVNAIKRREGVDYFDIGTNFKPLRFRASVALTRGASVISNVGNLRESSTLDQGQ
jgi:hypothetical protein